VYRAGLVLALSLKVPRITLRHSLRLAKRASPERQALERSATVLSACTPHNPLARRYHTILSHYQQLLEIWGEVGNASTEQTQACELSSATNLRASTSLSTGESGTTTTDPTELSSPIFSEGSSTTFSWSQPASYDVGVVPIAHNAAGTGLNLPPSADYPQPSVSNPAKGVWVTPSLSRGSTYPIDADSMWQSNPYLKEYLFRSTFAQP
jgi:hypothetical protein